MIEDLRKEIDLIDNEIKDLLIRRFDISSEIGKLKKAQEKDICDLQREREILDNLSKNLSNDQKEQIKKIYNLIFKLSKELQK